MVGNRGGLAPRRLHARRTGLALIGVLMTGPLWSCAGSSKGGDLPTGPVSEADFMQKVVDAICKNVGGCCATAGIPYDPEGCERYGLEELVVPTQPPNTTWDSTEAGKCVDLYARIASSCTLLEVGDNPCLRIYRGTLREGATCIDSYECAAIRGSEAICAPDATALTSSCTPEIAPVRGRSGDTCITTCASRDCNVFGAPADGTYTVCYLDDGLLCSFNSGTCVPLPALGEPCSDFFCEPGSYCSLSEQTCQSTKPDGATCEFSEECIAGSCADFRCGPQTIASPEVCSGQ
jgi:hypothetical protein